MPRRTKKQTPAQLAESFVRKFFDELVESPEFTENELDAAIGQVNDALLAEHEQAHGSLKDGDHTHVILGQEAGYLVGVQVGRRLGGAR